MSTSFYTLGDYIERALIRVPDRPTENRVMKCLTSELRKLLQYAATEVHDFEFRGHRTWCDNPKPHPPHVVGYYDCLDGKCEKFCLGRSGYEHEPEIMSGGKLYATYLGIVVEDFETGDVDRPTKAKGFYFRM